jgi:hypothetical protein
MTLFFCYPQTAVSEINKICAFLPDDIRDMTDTRCLRSGQICDSVVAQIVRGGYNYIIFYINSETANSQNMESGLECIIQAEKENGRNILIPILTDRRLLQAGYLSKIGDGRCFDCEMLENFGDIAKMKADDYYRAVAASLLSCISVLFVLEKKRRLIAESVDRYLSADDEITGKTADFF